MHRTIQQVPVTALEGNQQARAERAVARKLRRQATVKGFFPRIITVCDIACVMTFLILLVACAGRVELSGGEDRADVMMLGTNLIYHGSISHEANTHLFDLAASSSERPKMLVITSRGGNVEAGIELGTWVFNEELDVHVPEFCVSSCANYVFVAGNRKFLGETAMLIWHGGATQQFDIHSTTCADANRRGEIEHCDERELRSRLTDYVTKLRSLESAFFKKIEVNQKITVLGQEPEYDCREGGDYLGWYYSIDDLETLGVSEVIVLGERWRPIVPTPGVKICRVELETVASVTSQYVRRALSISRDTRM